MTMESISTSSSHLFLDNLYKPNPSEEAYAFFILGHAFAINNYFSPDFNVPGYVAVPFFSKSGLDRLILRNIWTVVDPNSIGYLSCIDQFHCILRLISLAQAGILTRDLSKAIIEHQTLKTTIRSPADVMAETLKRSSDNFDLSLPTFEGLPNPSADELKNLYYKVKNGNVNSKSANSIHSSINHSNLSDGASSMHSNISDASQISAINGKFPPLQSYPPQSVQQNQGGNGFGGLEQANKPDKLHVTSNANFGNFSAAGDIMDKAVINESDALPNEVTNNGLQPSIPQTWNASNYLQQQPLSVLSTDLNQEQQEVGAFDALGLQDLPLPGLGQLSSNMTGHTGAISNQERFGMDAFGTHAANGAQDAIFPSLGSSEMCSTQLEVPLHLSNNQGDGNLVLTADSDQEQGMDPFNMLFNGVQDAPLQSLEEITSNAKNIQITEKRNNDQPGGFSVKPNIIPVYPTTIEKLNEEKGSKGFGAFNDALLINEKQDTKNFGEFENTTSLPRKPDLVQTVDDFGSFGGFSSNEVKEEVLDGFGAFNDTQECVKEQTSEDLSEIKISSFLSSTRPPVQTASDNFAGFEGSSSENVKNKEFYSFGAFNGTQAVTGKGASEGFVENKNTNSLSTKPNPTQIEDDFGDFEGVSHDAAEDTQLDGFGSFNDTPAAVEQQASENFGGFENTNSVFIQPNQEQTPDDFGSFEGLSGDAVEDNELSGFGSFNDTSAAVEKHKTSRDFVGFDNTNTTSESATPNPTQIVDDFGGFEGAPQDIDKEMEFGSFGALNGTPAIVEKKAAEDFGEFENSASTKPSMIKTTDDFGNFEGSSRDVSKEKELESFGAFNDTSAVFVERTSEDLGEFESTNAALAQSNPKETTDGFGDFEGSVSGDFSMLNSNTMKVFRDQIDSFSQQIPEAICRNDCEGNVDFKHCFDMNMGMEGPWNQEHKRRAERCVQVMSLLSSTHTRLASTYWKQVLSMSRDELTLGNSLLEEVSILTSIEMLHVKESLQFMVSGLSEFVRLCRSIVATVGDILSLDPSAPLTVDTFASTWCSIVLVEATLEVEKLWKLIQQRCSKIGLIVTNKLESLTEIRSNCMQRYNSNELCQFSLQPLSSLDKGTTKAVVEWKGKKFMACAANLLAFKCHSYDLNN